MNSDHCKQTFCITSFCILLFWITIHAKANQFLFWKDKQYSKTDNHTSKKFSVSMQRIRRKSVPIYKSFHIPLMFLSNKTLRCRLRFSCKRLFVVSSIKYINGNVAYMRVNAIVQSAVFFHKILKRKCFNIILIKNRLEYVHCSLRKHNLLWL